MVERKKVEAEWRKANSALAHKLDMFLSGKLPDIDYRSIAVKSGSATRAASATVLGVYAEQVENMIVASADLSNSDKTDGFLKKTHAFKRGDFSGKFFQAGVSEFTMACVMNGMALHGGVIPACGTFFVFSDYMKPVVRLSALMKLHVIYVWTHDSFRVGEDGPTHQPIEQEAQIRLMEHLRNHDGERSMVVLRPADAEESVAAWKIALEEHRPVGLIFSRQDIKSLPSHVARIDEAMQAYKGAYTVVDSAKPQVVMVASGSEVSTLVAGAELLMKEGIAVRVVSVPSEGLFRDQPLSYQNSVLPAGALRYGMTSGLPVTLLGLVGSLENIHGLDHFGHSAPYKVLDEKFGYNGETVYNEVKKLLGK
jgi:transketolase